MPVRQIADRQVQTVQQHHPHTKREVCETNIRPIHLPTPPPTTHSPHPPTHSSSRPLIIFLLTAATHAFAAVGGCGWEVSGWGTLQRQQSYGVMEADRRLASGLGGCCGCWWGGGKYVFLESQSYTRVTFIRTIDTTIISDNITIPLPQCWEIFNHVVI